MVNNGEVVGTALAAFFGPDIAALSMIIVDKALRGRGLGRRLTQATIDLTGSREQRLIATEAGLALYEKLGFTATGRILQHQGNIGQISNPGGAYWFDASERDAIVELDVAASGMKREHMIDSLVRIGKIAVTRRNNTVSGFAVLRPFGHGEVVGPVVASNDGDARSLLSFLFSERTGTFMRIDCDATTGLAPWLESYGLAAVGDGITMIRQPGSSAQTTEVSTYALVNQALG